MKLLVISDAPILTYNGKKEAYAPYVREMDLWMTHSSDVTFLSPTKYNHKLLLQPFKKQDFYQIGLRRLEFHTLLSALISVITIPYQAFVLWNAMRKADHVHLRCPGNLGLLASFVQITLPRKRKTVKYAGNFSPTASQPLSYSWQKNILSNTRYTKNIDVLVYGEWPNQTQNIKPFFTATYSEKDRGTYKKEFKEPLQFIFVGTLSQNKNPQLLVELVKQLNQHGISSQAHFYGDGPMMDDLQVQSSKFRVQSFQSNSKETYPLGLGKGFGAYPISNDEVQNLKRTNRIFSEKEPVSPLEKCPQDNGVFFFHGNQPSAIVQAAYQNAHFSFLASQSEGWPKAVAESMWYGCIPIATPVSCVPWMLGINYELRVMSSELGNDEKQETYPLGLGKGLDTSSSEACLLAKADRERFNDINLGSRGLIFNDVGQTITLLKFILENPELMNSMSQNAQNWSQEYTLEKFESEIVKLLKS